MIFKAYPATVGGIKYELLYTSKLSMFIHIHKATELLRDLVSLVLGIVVRRKKEEECVIMSRTQC